MWRTPKKFLTVDFNSHAAMSIILVAHVSPEPNNKRTLCKWDFTFSDN